MSEDIQRVSGSGRGRWKGRPTNLLPAAGTILDGMAVLESDLLVENGGAAVVAVRVDRDSFDDRTDPGTDRDIRTTEPGGVASPRSGDRDRPRGTPVCRFEDLLVLGQGQVW